MATSIQDQLDNQREESTENATAGISELPLLTDEAMRNDTRRVDTVEINLSNQTARVVESSDAPLLTLDVVKEKAAPIQPETVIFDQKEWKVLVKMGVPFHANARHSKLVDEANDTEDPTELKALDDKVKNLYISEMIESPKFSFEGKGEGKPIEECSDLLRDELWSAFSRKNSPIADDIYQVKVLRGTPIHASILLTDSFSLYPAPLAKRVIDMTDAEIEQTTQRSLSQRRIMVSSMVFPEGFCFSLNGEGSEGEKYPIEDVSEMFLATLHTAYRVVNVPAAGLEAVHRFQGVDGNNSG